MSISADVLVAGAGPTGLMLAAELAASDVDVAVVDRRLAPTAHPKETGLSGTRPCTCAGSAYWRARI
ncbi:FAD-dependent monooxygenase [Humibacter antri]